MVLSKDFDAIEVVDARLGFCKGFLIDVGRIEQCPVFQTLFAEQNHERIELFPGAAAGDPDLQRRVGAEMGNDSLPNCPEIGGIAKHLADLNRQVSEELRQHCTVVQQPVLHGGGGRKTEVIASPLQTTLERGHGVSTKVKVVLLEQRLQQQ